MKTSLLTLLLVCDAGTVFAQAPASPPDSRQRAEQQLERLTILLDLTETQKAQVKAVIDAERTKLRVQFEAARASGNKPSFEQMRAAREQLKAETAQQLTPVLNATQLKKFEVLMEQEHGPGFDGHRSGASSSSSDTSPN